MKSFEIDDVLKEIENKNKTKTEVTAYLDRSFFEGMIRQYHEGNKIQASSLFAENRININEYNFSGADFRNIKRADFDLFDFTNCDISYVKLDRIGIEFFKKYMENGNIKYTNLDLEASRLSPRYYKSYKLGIECILMLNLSNLNLSGTNFKNCDISSVNFDDSNIEYCNFIGAINMNPKQFAYTLGYNLASFFEDEKNNIKFIEKITKLSKIQRNNINENKVASSSLMINMFDSE